MIDLFLRAATEAEMDAALTAAGMLTKEGYPAEGVSIDRIGQDPQRVTGVDAAGDPIIQTLAGYHCNIRGALTAKQVASLAPVTIATPSVPLRVWA